MPKIEKTDLRQVDYTEFGRIMDTLVARISESGVVYDVLVPILRGGGLTGMHLAYTFGITNILPAQYKHTRIGDVVTSVKKFELPRLNYELSAQANILVVDTNTARGRTAVKVIADVRELFPSATIDFASASLDQSLIDSGIARRVYYGVLSNEERLLTAQEAAVRGISNDILVFPWENAEDQWLEIRELKD